MRKYSNQKIKYILIIIIIFIVLNQFVLRCTYKWFMQNNSKWNVNELCSQFNSIRVENSIPPLGSPSGVSLFISNHIHSNDVFMLLLMSTSHHQLLLRFSNIIIAKLNFNCVSMKFLLRMYVDIQIGDIVRLIWLLASREPASQGDTELQPTPQLIARDDYHFEATASLIKVRLTAE